MALNGVNREIPEKIKGKEKVIPFKDELTNFPEGRMFPQTQKRYAKDFTKIVKNIDEAIEKVGLKDGDTISFHHHFRNGDQVLNMVMDIIADKGIKDLTITSSSFTSAHQYIAKYVRSGVISQIITSGLRGELGEMASRGEFKKPVIFHSHGGRPRRIESGDVQIKCSFIAAPGCDFLGNINGVDSDTPCGSLGYAVADARFADNVVAITTDIKKAPLNYYSIPHYYTDYIVEVDKIGDPSKIGTGATRITKNPVDLLIAQRAAKIIATSPYFKENFSFQTGSGGASLATAKYLKDYMKKSEIKGNFAIGGITGYLVDLYKEGYFKTLFDVQSFDKKAAESLRENEGHVEIDATNYANPFTKSPLVNSLDIVILSALEIDTDFNVNVLTGSNGVIRGASGGHSDTAYGADLTIIVAPSFRGRIPTVVEKTLTVVTPGDSVDILVTERGIAVNPKRKDILEWIEPLKKEMPIYTIEELKDIVYNLTGRPEPIKFSDEIVGIVEYRDGSIIDVIKKIEE